MIRESPLLQLMICNTRRFFREPEAIFWSYGFPLLMIIGLGIAFDSSREGPVSVFVVEAPDTSDVVGALHGRKEFEVETGNLQQALDYLKWNRVQVAVVMDKTRSLHYHWDPSNPESRQARDAVDRALQEAAGRVDPYPARDEPVTVPGSRYVDFLVPGLIGMNLMGGGLWGVGFVIVDFRIKKLLKRLLATPMKRVHFLASMIGTRVFFFIPEAFVMLVVAHWIFGVPIQGEVFSILVVALFGALTFAGLGLLAASRAQRIESISGIMNVIMLPMWICSGIFFSAERFPAVIQPFIQALPLTQLINALRSVILEGQSWIHQAVPLLILAAWGGLAFFVALKWFRWS